MEGGEQASEKLKDLAIPEEEKRREYDLKDHFFDGENLETC